MYQKEGIAIAFPNIAFIKYWGDSNPDLHIPANGSISMNLGDLQTQTKVTFDPKLNRDVFILNGEEKGAVELNRVSQILDHVRQISKLKLHAHIDSKNNFPTGAGIASSASGFAALSMAASCAAGLQLTEPQISRLARRGSGSACRSVPDGFVEWLAGEDDHSSYAVSIAKHDHWNLIDCIAVVNQSEKAIPSLDGHSIAQSSPLQTTRLEGSRQRLDICRQAILDRDFETLARISELDSNMMHAVMLTSSPILIYWQPATIAVMKEVSTWRKEAIPVFYTIDAGPNVHVICENAYKEEVKHRLKSLPGIQFIIESQVGSTASCIQQHIPSN